MRELGNVTLGSKQTVSDGWEEPVYNSVKIVYQSFIVKIFIIGVRFSFKKIIT